MDSMDGDNILYIGGSNPNFQVFLTLRNPWWQWVYAVPREVPYKILWVQVVDVVNIMKWWENMLSSGQ